MVLDKGHNEFLVTKDEILVASVEIKDEYYHSVLNVLKKWQQELLIKD